MFLRTPHAIDEWVAGDFRADHKLGCTRPRSERALCLYQSRAKGVETCCARFAQRISPREFASFCRDTTALIFAKLRTQTNLSALYAVVDGSSPRRRKRVCARAVARTRAFPLCIAPPGCAISLERIH